MQESRLIYIGGANFSGSTLLDLLLNNHSEIISTGEVHRLSFDPFKRLCSCGNTFNNCDFWEKIISEYIKRHNLDTNNWYKQKPISVDKKAPQRTNFAIKKLQQLILVMGSSGLLKFSSLFNRYNKRSVKNTRNSWELFDLISKHEKSKFVLDSSKSPGRLKRLYLTRPARTKIIHLVRDGRAVVASGLRKGIFENIREPASKWKKTNFNIEAVCKSIPGKRKMLVRYEDLCDEPKNVLKQICGFLKIDYEIKMNKLNKIDAHDVPGNSMLFKYENRAIKKDEKWKKELTDKELKTFDRIAGNFNRKYGYI